jgi:hypothetical protein
MTAPCGVPFCEDSVFDHARFQPEANQTQYSLVGDPVLQKTHHPPVIDFIEERADVRIQNPVHPLAADCRR